MTRRHWLVLAAGVVAVSWAAPLIRLTEAPAIVVAALRLTAAAPPVAGAALWRRRAELRSMSRGQRSGARRRGAGARGPLRLLDRVAGPHLGDHQRGAGDDASAVRRTRRVVAARRAPGAVDLPGDRRRIRRGVDTGQARPQGQRDAAWSALRAARRALRGRLLRRRTLAAGRALEPFVRRRRQHHRGGCAARGAVREWPHRPVGSRETPISTSCCSPSCPS